VFIASSLILAVYFYSSQSGYLYFMSNDFEKPLVRQSLLAIALPGLLFAEGVTLLIGFFIALWVSRKIAVPLYKLEQWAGAIAEGNLNLHLQFREKGQHQSLMRSCNAAGARVRNTFSELDRLLNDPALLEGRLPPDSQAVVDRARALLKEWRFRGSGEKPPS
jgi:methyl-accepting chemotaxis protein